MTAVSLSSVDEESDIRDAARIAARRDGLSLGDWLDNVMTKRAKSLGLDLSELSPDQRIHAVIKDLGWSEEARPAAEPSRAPVARTIAGEQGMAIVARLGNTYAEDARQAVSRPAAADGSESVAQEAEQAVATVSRQAAQRVEIETKLNALFKALDRPARRSESAASVIDAPEASLEAARVQTLLGETAITPSWRLEKAVSEIAERQAFLDQQTAAEASSRASGPQRRHSDSRDGGSVAAAVRQDDALVRTDVVRSRVASDGVPSIFTSLQGDIARLAKRLDAVDLSAARRPASPNRASSFTAIRALLDEMRPDASIDTLGKHVEALSQKLDKVGDARAPAEAINRLSQRIEEVHADVAARLAVPAAAPAIDVDAIEQMVRDVIARSDLPGRSKADLHGLEEAVRDLGDRLERAERSQIDGTILTDLQAKVGTLAGRIDRSEAGLSAIVAMERSLSDLFLQMGDLRDGAVTAARSAAEDAVRTAVAEAPVAAPLQTSVADPAVEQVSQDLAEFRAAREEADKRLHAILAALNTSLERVVDRLGALEDDVAGSADRPTATAAAPAFVPPQPEATKAPDALEAVPATSTSTSPQPALWTARQLLLPDIKSSAIDLDAPLEPGSGTPRQRIEVQPVDVPVGPPDPTNFIAAARRAAQTAAQEQANRSDAAGKARSRLASSVTASAADKVRETTGSRRRPLILALASLVLLMGAAQIVRLSLSAGSGNAPVREAAASNDATTPPAETPAVPAKSAEAVQTVAPPIDSASAAPPVVAAPEPVAAAKPEAAPPAQSLPTLAMGPAANLAAAQLAESTAKAAASAGTLPPALRDMAQDGHADAQYELGLRYADGRGVARDLKTAATWFEKAANQGLAPAAYRIGSLYERGLGVPRDAARSIAWYQKAADAGNVRAMHNLAVMLAEGAAGKADYASAASWFTKAAEAGVKDSQFNLAVLYARGLGLDQNLSQSYTWFTLAAAQGDTDSAKKRDDIAPRLDAAALEAAKKAAETFKPTTPSPAANEVPVPPGGWDAVAPASPSNSPSGKGSAHISSM